MGFSVFPDWVGKGPEARARWFQSLSIEERMEWLCDITNLVLSVNPSLAEKEHDETQKGVRVLRLP